MAIDPESSAGGPGDGVDSADSARDFAAVLGIAFRDLDLLRLALTHRSVTHELALAAPKLGIPPARQSNERLEFLGDAILGHIVADFLYERHPDAPEGVLTAQRVALIRAERLVVWARELDLGAHLHLGQGERVSDGARDRMLAGAFEAVIAAITLDRGMREARRFLRRFLLRDTAQVLLDHAEANPKGRLQEVLQERHRTAPVYTTVHEEGLSHAMTFTVEVAINGEVLGIGLGPSKRGAEEAAAVAALDAIAAGIPAEPVAAEVVVVDTPGVGRVNRVKRKRRTPGEST